MYFHSFLVCDQSCASDRSDHQSWHGIVSNPQWIKHTCEQTQGMGCISNFFLAHLPLFALCLLVFVWFKWDCPTELTSFEFFDEMNLYLFCLVISYNSRQNTVVIISCTISYKMLLSFFYIALRIYHTCHRLLYLQTT